MRSLTVINVQGTFSAATGQFTQTGGRFEKVSGSLLPASAPVTNEPQAPALSPDPGAAGVLYTGTYTLQSGESGEFNLFVSDNNMAEGLGVPADFLRYAMDPTPQSTGSATVTVQISGATGSGVIQLSNNDSGAITITGKTLQPAGFRALKSRLSRALHRGV